MRSRLRNAEYERMISEINAISPIYTVVRFPAAPGCFGADVRTALYPVSKHPECEDIIKRYLRALEPSAAYKTLFEMYEEKVINREELLRLRQPFTAV